MRRTFVLIASAALLFFGGCKRQHSLSDFKFRPGLTAEQLEDEVGSPAQVAPSSRWVTYDLGNETELRVYFLAGKRGGPRSLSEAAIYSRAGTRLKTVYVLHPATEPSTTNPSSTQP